MPALITSAWIWGLNWALGRFAGDTYFHWYVQNEALISVATAFLARVWHRSTSPGCTTVHAGGPTTTLQVQPSTKPVPDGALDVSFGARPVALTSALNGAVLLIAKLLPAAGT